MSEPPAFISLARRLGNPIAEMPEAVAIVALSELARDLQSSPRRSRIVRVTRDCLVWLKTIKLDRSH
jgi:hypothetical protein